MVTCKPIDYDVLCDELLKHYLSPEYYQATKAQIKYVVSKVTATTIDEYIRLLSEGYINVEVREELDKYIDGDHLSEAIHRIPFVSFHLVITGDPFCFPIGCLQQPHFKETVADLAAFSIFIP